jgi:hypothetical protein
VQWAPGAWLISLPFQIPQLRPAPTNLYAPLTSLCARFRLSTVILTDTSREFISSHGVKMQKASSTSTIPNVTVRVSGKIFQGHLSYLDQLVQTAGACELWVLLDLQNLQEIDRPALLYLMRGEGHAFDLIACPNFIREWMSHEFSRCAA